MVRSIVPALCALCIVTGCARRHDEVATICALFAEKEAELVRARPDDPIWEERLGRLNELAKGFRDPAIVEATYALINATQDQRFSLWLEILDKKGVHPDCPVMVRLARATDPLYDVAQELRDATSTR
jgi:hypothetical protein